ncbi:MAG: prepilin peptidase [Myxococcales bacterium]|jgi:leader peptidase (prepilin peptidase)/N-methyltransferase
MTPFAALSTAPVWFLVGSAFLFGASIGSFLNVVIARVPLGRSIVWPPSHCGSCGKSIEPFHNIPIVSWFHLRGRCSNCLAPFSIRYALIELAFAAICAFAVYRHGLGWDAAREIALLGFLLPLAMIDLDTWLLPNELTYTGTVVGLLLTLPQGRAVFMQHLLAAAVAYTGLMLLGAIGERVFGKEAIGRGDLGLVALIGAFLGLKALFPVLLLSSLQGSLIGIAMILARRRRAGSSVSQPETEAAEIDSAEARRPLASAAEAPAGAAAAESAGPALASSIQAAGEGSVAVPAARPAASAAAAPRAIEPAPAADGTEAAASRPQGVTVVAKPADDGWVPDPTAIPFGPFLALAAAEVHYFSRLPHILLPF